MELVSQLLGNALVALSVQLAAVDIGDVYKRQVFSKDRVPVTDVLGCVVEGVSQICLLYTSL